MNYFRRQRYEKEWTKKVDIGIIYRIEKATGQLRKLTEDKSLEKPLKKRFLTEIEELELNLAVAQGKVKKFDLKKEQMPEDEKPAVYRKPSFNRTA